MSEPTPLASILDALFAQEGPRRAAEIARIWTEWERWVGPDLARQAQPLDWKDRILWLQVPSSAHAQEMALRKPEILEAIRRGLGQGWVDDLRCRVVAPAPGRPPGPP